jgi:hypothetical protein
MKIQEEGAISRVRCDKHEEEQLKIKKKNINKSTKVLPVHFTCTIHKVKFRSSGFSGAAPF